MKIFLFCLALFAGFASGQDLIQVNARFIPVKGEVPEDATQQDLADLVESADDSDWFASSATVLSGDWTVSKKAQEFWYPADYEALRFVKAKSDHRIFSIKPTSLTDNKSSLILPSQPLKLVKKDLGTTVKIKPTLRSDGSIHLEGSVSDLALAGFAEKNPNPEVTVQKRHQKAKKIFLTSDSRKSPVFVTSRKSFSTVLSESRKKIYEVLYVTKSSLDQKHPESLTDLSHIHEKANHKKRIAANHISPPLDGSHDRFPVIVMITAKEATPSPVSSRGKGDKILIHSKFIESDEPLTMNNSIMTEAQYSLLVRSLSQKKGVDFMSAPSLLARSGQDAKMEVAREFIYPTIYLAADIDLSLTEGKNSSFPVTPAQPVEFKIKNTGVSLEINATLQEDGTIQIDTEYMVTEFKGFINYGNPAVTPTTNRIGKTVPVVVTENRIETPVFFSRNQKTSVRIPENTTFVLGGLFGEVQQSIQDKGPLGLRNRTTTESTPRYLSILITAKRSE